MTSESTILQREGVTVTDARFIVGSQTYAIRNITSVKGIEIIPGPIGRLLGYRSMFAIVLSTAGGEIQAYQSKDSDLIGDVLEALNQAIIRQR